MLGVAAVILLGDEGDGDRIGGMKLCFVFEEAAFVEIDVAESNYVSLSCA